MLEIQHISVTLGAVTVLQDVSLTVQRGQITALLGANGAGKTTTLRTISGLYHPQAGHIFYQPTPQSEAIDISKIPAEQIVSLGIAHCPEGRQVFAGLTVRQNLLLGAYLRHDKQAIAEDIAWIETLFPILGERQRQLAGSLSGGEQEMLAIGRALMSRPQCLMLDEPSLGLAPMIVDRILDTLLEINKKGVTILLVEQNAHLALEIAHYGYVLETGRVSLSGRSAELIENAEVRKAYLGEM